MYKNTLLHVTTTNDPFFPQHLGPSALAGIATVILIFPLNGFIAKHRSKLQVH